MATKEIWKGIRIGTSQDDLSKVAYRIFMEESLRIEKIATE